MDLSVVWNGNFVIDNPFNIQGRTDTVWWLPSGYTFNKCVPMKMLIGL